ncbi:MAG TPA: thiamine phosphate synthase [Pyrinomonadaceae bacterium]
MLPKTPELPRPIIYLITNGATSSKTTPDSEEFSQVLTLVQKAVTANIPLVQIREKALTARVLYELTRRAAAIVENSSTYLLVNDRLDVALAAGAHGVQLTSKSLPVPVIREVSPSQFIVGVSTHSLTEAEAARSGGADFILFGPVFQTESKRAFGEPQGIGKLATIVQAVGALPVIAIGGIGIVNLRECFVSGASGVAAIRLLSDPATLQTITSEIHRQWNNEARD